MRVRVSRSDDENSHCELAMDIGVVIGVVR